MAGNVFLSKAKLSRRDAAALLVGGTLACVAAGRVRAASGSVFVLLHTDAGDLEFEVNTGRAPLTARRFLEYIDASLFDGGGFYRAVHRDRDPSPIKIDVLQGGIMDETRRLPPVPHEATNKTGLKHVDGTLSIGRRAVGTGSAEAFFICIGDQPELDFGGKRNPDGKGFAAFGRVSRGMDVAKIIWNAPFNTRSPAKDELQPPIMIRRCLRSPS